MLLNIYHPYRVKYIVNYISIKSGILGTFEYVEFSNKMYRKELSYYENKKIRIKHISYILNIYK